MRVSAAGRTGWAGPRRGIVVAGCDLQNFRLALQGRVPNGIGRLASWSSPSLTAKGGNLMRNPVPLTGFIQIAIVVEDIEAAIDAWCELFDAPRPQVRVTAAEPNPNETYHGEVAAYGLKLAVIDFTERGFIIELHEPDQNPSTFGEFLDKHGNGVHHVGFQVGDARDAVVGEMESMGHALRTVGMYPDGSWTIVDGEDNLGVNLNVKPHL
jgi:catechol 2,3-dioxygenase-like lactoylglutathione lyase family enzyme